MSRLASSTPQTSLLLNCNVGTADPSAVERSRSMSEREPGAVDWHHREALAVAARTGGTFDARARLESRICPMAWSVASATHRTQCS
jgi:hypothetical protein